MHRDSFLRSACVVTLLFSVPVVSQENAGLQAPPKAKAADSELTAQYIEAQITAIQAATELPDEIKAEAAKIYGEAKEKLEESEKWRGRAESYKGDIEKASQRAKELRSTLVESVELPASRLTAWKKMERGELDVELAKIQADLLAAKSAAEEKSRQLSEEKERPQAARKQLQEARDRLAKLESETREGGGDEENATLAAAKRAALLARRLAVNDEIRMLEQEELSRPMRLELLEVESEVAEQVVRQHEAAVAPLDQLIADFRAADAEAAKHEAERARQEASDKHPLIKELAENNAELGGELTRVEARTNAVNSVVPLTQQRAQKLGEVLKRTSGQLNRAGVSGVGAKVMREQRARIDDVLYESGGVESEWLSSVAAAEAAHFQLGSDLRELQDFDAAVEAAIADQRYQIAELPADQRQQIVAEVREQLQASQSLKRNLQQAYDRQLKSLADLTTARSELRKTASDFSLLLDEWLLWIPSASLPTLQTAKDLLGACGWILSPENWVSVASTIATDFRTQPVIHLAFLVIWFVLVMSRRRLRERLKRIAESVGRIFSDRFVSTLDALLTTLLFVAPAPLVGAFFGWRLAAGSAGVTSPFADAVGHALLMASLAFFALRFGAALCRSHGIARVHFRWRQSSLDLIRRHLLWLMGTIAATTLIVVLTERAGLDAQQNSLGRLAFVVATAAQAVFLQRVLRPRGGVVESVLTARPEGWLARLRYVWYPLAVALPVALAIVAIVGYYYTALVLERRVVATVCLVVIAVGIHNLALRWLTVEARRMAIEKARRDREARSAESAPVPKVDGATEAGPAVVESAELDLVTVNDQSRKLLRTLIGMGTVVGCWLIWSGVLPALAVLDEVKILGTALTLGEVAIATIVLVLTIAAAKNLPGVLEIVVLKNLPLDAGIRYAISTVSQYALTAIGLMLGFKAIGIGWDNIQWLVAALGVGIGFGLQEIIANFFCGLILLFERPIRIGDIVTVGDVTGTVSKIRIRATTIINWDRKEYVVPNKELITGRLLNWTLSNTVNRVVINVGVAYGSDTETTRSLLLEVARAHPLVMQDPAPIATFEGFGDSTLNFVLRCYLPDFANRLETVHQLHTAINEAFAEAGLEIAFPQLDLHLRSADSTLKVARDGGVSDTSTDATPVDTPEHST